MTIIMFPYSYLQIKDNLMNSEVGRVFPYQSSAIV